ncbi:hypothetical protein DASC09_022660 [Saccharomycopsis crataegensis]|uniref:C2H2-type domain-containing protein n=1 Tax=Saccharomycopsis crataegensis TaxID=43959 RepID=A0AAV5QJS9_9ASCO|nr:hypothetical protein DASC09_022660 [Saccharomycopsis crataegensis]
MLDLDDSHRFSTIDEDSILDFSHASHDDFQSPVPSPSLSGVGGVHRFSALPSKNLININQKRVPKLSKPINIKKITVAITAPTTIHATTAAASTSPDVVAAKVVSKNNQNKTHKSNRKHRNRHSYPNPKLVSIAEIDEGITRLGYAQFEEDDEEEEDDDEMNSECEDRSCLSSKLFDYKKIKSKTTNTKLKSISTKSQLFGGAQGEMLNLSSIKKCQPVACAIDDDFQFTFNSNFTVDINSNIYNPVDYNSNNNNSFQPDLAFMSGNFNMMNNTMNNVSVLNGGALSNSVGTNNFAGSTTIDFNNYKDDLSSQQYLSHDINNNADYANGDGIHNNACFSNVYNDPYYLNKQQQTSKPEQSLPCTMPQFDMNNNMNVNMSLGLVSIPSHSQFMNSDQHQQPQMQHFKNNSINKSMPIDCPGYEEYDDELELEDDEDYLSFTPNNSLPSSRTKSIESFDRSSRMAQTSLINTGINSTSSSEHSTPVCDSNITSSTTSIIIPSNESNACVQIKEEETSRMVPLSDDLTCDYHHVSSSESMSLPNATTITSMNNPETSDIERPGLKRKRSMPEEIWETQTNGLRRNSMSKRSKIILMGPSLSTSVNSKMPTVIQRSMDGATGEDFQYDTLEYTANQASYEQAYGDEGVTVGLKNDSFVEHAKPSFVANNSKTVQLKKKSSIPPAFEFQEQVLDLSISPALVSPVTATSMGKNGTSFEGVIVDGMRSMSSTLNANSAQSIVCSNSSNSNRSTAAGKIFDLKATGRLNRNFKTIHYQNGAIMTKTKLITPPKKPVVVTLYECADCGAKFRVKGYLSRHAKRHSKLKAFSCPFFKDNAETEKQDADIKEEDEEEKDKSSGTDSDSTDASSGKDISNHGHLHSLPIGSKCHPSGGFSRRDTYKTHLKAIHFIYPAGTKSTARNDVAGRCGGCSDWFVNNNVWLEDHIEGGKCVALQGRGMRDIRRGKNTNGSSKVE